MFILNQTNDDCIEIHRIKMCKHYNDDVTKKINNIRSKYRNNAYNYGSTENAMRRADKEIDDFLYNIKNVYYCKSNHKKCKSLQVVPVIHKPGAQIIKQYFPGLGALSV